MVALAVLLMAGRALAADRLEIVRSPSGPALSLQGENGREYVLEGASDPGAGAWQVLLRSVLSSGRLDWADPLALTEPHRFYRLGKFPAVSSPVAASNFRLLDVQGKSRELQYHSNKRAVVLIFADAACTGLEPLVPSIQALRQKYEPQGVLFWMVAPDASSTRAQLAERAAALGIDWPVLHDAAQLVAREIRPAALPEVVCISTGAEEADWKIFYRGAVDDRMGDGKPATRNYLSDALAALLAGQPASPSQTMAVGCEPKIAAPQPVSYAREVAPILQARCVYCHSAGNIAPWEMSSFDAVKSYAALIKKEVMTGAMPPWHADPTYGKFSNDQSFAPGEAEKILQWLAEGAPRGEGADPLAELFGNKPPTQDYPSTWPADLGPPDHVLTIPKFSVPATGEVDYQYIPVEVDIPEDKWLRAAVILPGNTKVVHHSLVFVGTLLDVLLQGGGLNGYFASYVPGQKAVVFPQGTAKRLRANSTLTFQMHYTPSGQAGDDETKLGLYFAPVAPKAELHTTAAFTISFTIPKGAPEHEVSATTKAFPKDVLIHELSPHMHYRGARMKFEALYPGGKTEVLLSVPKYEFHWQTLYRLAEPKRLPAGTRVRCTGAFDNSPQNHENPDPSQSVRFGEQSDEEMFIGYMNYSEVVP